MKKFLLSLFFLLIFSFSLLQSVDAQIMWAPSAAFDEYSSDESSYMLHHSVYLRLLRNRSGGIEKDRGAIEALYHGESRKLFLTGGLHYNINTFDVTLNGIYFFHPSKKIHLGAGMLYHFGTFRDISNQHDIHIGFYSIFNILRNINYSLNFSFNANITHQFNTIPALGSGHSTIEQTDLASYIQLELNVSNNIRLSLGLTSYELFRFDFFASPTFIFHVEYRHKRIIIGISNSLRYSDAFTGTAYPYDTLFGINLGYKFN